ncbi:metalloregulator ArsR/SmtB family transcription factor [Actibacterium sp. MT2.3-13A]|uniref:ArsR/SmtB family transcription factor n=1 Tax=Actibacterium sp. MT2.3-13A TaxID=2828332 RepID=UPI001BA50A43|nr:metalloregulator ArsR/SmtB family transcription factor [Actibacterium sp. MT2.3-13A]
MSTSPKTALLEEYALVARALSAPPRLVILEQLAQGERGVEALARKVGLSLANCSQHLQHLRRAGLVDSRRDGKSVIYRLGDDRTLALMDLLREVAERNLAEVDRILRGLAGGVDLPEPITRSELAERLSDGSVTVLDVRPADEFALGHIPGAISVELSDLDSVLDRLDPKGTVVAYCRGPYCIYAHQAVAHLRRRGIDARRLEGGLPEWRSDGREVSRAG